MPDRRKRHKRRTRASIAPIHWLRLDDFRGRPYVAAFDRVESAHPDLSFWDVDRHPDCRKGIAARLYRWQRYTVRKDGRLRFQPIARARKIRS